jgi:hypothetical protein
MAEGAAFVCSGILEGRQAEVERALHSAGFAVTEHRGEENGTVIPAVDAGIISDAHMINFSSMRILFLQIKTEGYR